MYDLNLGSSVDDDHGRMISHILELTRELATWRSSLVYPLQLFTTQDTSTLLVLTPGIEARLRAILTLRYLNLRLMMHRPFLSTMLHQIRRTSGRSFLDASTASMVSVQVTPCIDAARETIDFVESIVNTSNLGTNMLGAWWFTMHFGNK